jgi:ADP-ribosylglycohydrolase
MGAMIGGIAGDIIGSPYEGRRAKEYAFPLFVPTCRFTDDTVMTLAIASALLDRASYRDRMWELGRRYPHAGYGGRFRAWLASGDPRPYNSYGNGSAMRVGAIPWFFDGEEDVLREALRSAEPTHGHPEGIKGAQATALAIRMALDGRSKPEIRRRITETFHYDLSRSCEQLHEHPGFDVTCQGTVPPAIIIFLESRSYEDAVRKAVFLGGDSDTLACIAGSIAEAFHGDVPEPIIREVAKRLPMDLLGILRDAAARHGAGRTWALLQPMIALREAIESLEGIELVPPRLNMDCLIARVAGGGQGSKADAVLGFIRSALDLRYGIIGVDFAGWDPGAAGSEIAGLLAEAAAVCTVLVVRPSPALAAALQPKLPKGSRVLERLEHAVKFADLLAVKALGRIGG